MHNKYIIIITNTEDPQVEFYTYTGTESGMKKRVLEKAQEIAHTIEVDEQDFPDSTDSIEYYEENKYWQVDIFSYEQEMDYIITVVIEKEMESICA